MTFYSQFSNYKKATIITCDKAIIGELAYNVI